MGGREVARAAGPGRRAVRAGGAMVGEGRVAAQKGGRGYFALVRLTYCPAGAAAAAPAATPAADPRLLEAAAVGAALGLELAGAAGRCEVSEVLVADVGSSPHETLAAVAAVRAAWRAVGFTPGEGLSGRLEGCVGPRLAPARLRERLVGPG